MPLLSGQDKGFVADNVRELIASSGLTAIRHIPDATAENLYGQNNVPYIAAETFPLELQSLLADTLTKMGADAVINILPNQELNPEDRVGISSVMYKVLSVEEQNCFGVVSHKTVRLVTQHGS